MKSILVTALATAAISLSGAAPVEKLCRGFVPENNMWIGVNDVSPLAMTGITESEFNAVIDKAEAIYKPEIAALGGNLVVERKWEDGTVNAYAQRSGKNWMVSMFGGLARHRTITADGFALVVCHEIGHHIGGAPKYASLWGGSDWASNEGQSDYFAGLKCLRKYFADEDNAGFLADKAVDQIVLDKCAQEHANQQDQMICARIALAGQSVAFLFQELRQETTAPNFATPDTRQVRKTSDNHPATQCRMDTYFAGGLCGINVSEPISQTDFKTGTCIAQTHRQGLRPGCWFAAR